MNQVTFWCPGTPITKGSGHSIIASNGRPITVQNNQKRLGPWERRISECAIEAGVKTLFTEKGAVELEMGFVLKRPKCHFKRDGVTLRDDAPSKPTTKKADVDKLVRACLDALSGDAYADDAQVTKITAEKSYCGVEMASPGVYIRVTGGTE